MKSRDFVRIYRKILHRPLTIIAILLLLTSFLSLQTNEGVVLGEFSDLTYNKQLNPSTPLSSSPSAEGSSLGVEDRASNSTIQQLSIPAALPVSINKSQTLEDITAKSVVILDPTTHTTLYAKNAHQKLPPASLTKITTAIVVLQNMNLEQIATVPENISEKAQGSLMGLVPGEKITVENLLWGMLVASGNDAAHTLAMNFPGGYNHFIEKMNELAFFLRLKNTHFTNPMGFDDENHLSSAYDLAVLAGYALRNPLFAEVVKTQTKTVVSKPFISPTKQLENPTTSHQQWHELKNTNELLGKIVGVTGIKTGYTNTAGECMAISLNQQNHTFIIIILGSQDRLKDAKTLINLL